MANIPGFQPGDAGSIPATRTIIIKPPFGGFIIMEAA